MLWLLIGAYFMGLVAASLRARYWTCSCAGRDQVLLVLAMLGTLLTVFLVNTNSTMPDWLLMSLWVGIGLLAGLGSREPRSAAV